ncbi:hypothetical protein [Streptomyces sp. PU-14G]|uniref:hypothetical protein n=1 Tax=Streptomyces sp. PU-14G TaxID=2800808 RepID=UPI0034DE1059
MGERIDTCIQLLRLNAEQVQCWRHEQPQHAEQLRSESRDYQRTPDSYRRLLTQPAAAVSEPA